MHPEKQVPCNAPVAVLEHLTGPSQGTVSFVGERQLNVVLRPDQILAVSAEEPSPEYGRLVARLQRSNSTFVLVPLEGIHLWVNGRLVESRRLENRDTIEFGETGPISRVYLYRSGQPGQVGLKEILSDAAAYVRSSRKPFAKRLVQVASQVGRRLARETTLLFRIGVVVALTALGLMVYQQNRISALLRQEIETGATQLESFSRLLAQAKKDTPTLADLAKIREELSGEMATSAERLAKLERRSTAATRVIAESRTSVLFLQGTYALREAATGRMLRHVVDKKGRIAILPSGAPFLSLEGTGPVAVRQFTGSGFLLSESGMVVTSRHVGQPWRKDVNVKALLSRGLKPVMIKFVAYLPGEAEGFAVSLVRASAMADLAVLRLERPLSAPQGLRLAEKPPSAGNEVVLLGYPTGIRSMLAQAGPAFIKQLAQDKKTDFWSVVARLAAAGRIFPLASRGIIGRISEEAIVYDAETTHGGSGGPVLDMTGSVVAVNTAILPEYGGSNLGVPVSHLRRLIADAKSQ